MMRLIGCIVFFLGITVDGLESAAPQSAHPAACSSGACADAANDTEVPSIGAINEVCRTSCDEFEDICAEMEESCYDYRLNKNMEPIVV
eukprot:jgi/Tetstr1/466956/TSEL_011410.t1